MFRKQTAPGSVLLLKYEMCDYSIFDCTDACDGRKNAKESTLTHQEKKLEQTLLRKTARPAEAMPIWRATLLESCQEEDRQMVLTPDLQVTRLSSKSAQMCARVE